MATICRKNGSRIFWLRNYLTIQQVALTINEIYFFHVLQIFIQIFRNYRDIFREKCMPIISNIAKYMEEKRRKANRDQKIFNFQIFFSKVNQSRRNNEIYYIRVFKLVESAEESAERDSDLPCKLRRHCEMSSQDL